MVAETALYIVIVTLFFLMLGGFGAAFYAFSTRTTNVEVKPLAEDIETISGNVLSKLSQSNADYFAEQADARLKVYDTKYDDFREKVQKFDVDKQKIDTQYTQIDQTLSNLSPTIERHTQSAMKIHNALTAEIGTRGQWGEGQIEVILDSLGFIEDTHYKIQPTLKPYADNPKGKKPDFVVFLPGGGAVAIDSKAITKSGFDAFYDAEEEKSNDERQKFLHQHAVNIWSHLKALAERNYPLGLAQDIGVQGPDMTIMYVPNEQFLQRAYTGVSKQLKSNMGGDLTQAAIDKKVILAHPMTLATFLILIKQQWDASKVTDDVREYMQTASALVDEVIEVYEAWEDVGTHIKNLSSSYNVAVKKTESNDRRGSSIRTVIEDFEALGASSAKKYSKGTKKGQKKSIESLTEIRITVDDAKGLSPMTQIEAEEEE